MTDTEQREAARQFVKRWIGKGKEDEEVNGTFRLSKPILPPSSLPVSTPEDTP